jgi:hypothetical protein
LHHIFWNTRATGFGKSWRDLVRRGVHLGRRRACPAARTAVLVLAGHLLHRLVKLRLGGVLRPHFGHQRRDVGAAHRHPRWLPNPYLTDCTDEQQIESPRLNASLNIRLKTKSTNLQYQDSGQ